MNNHPGDDVALTVDSLIATHFESDVMKSICLYLTAAAAFSLYFFPSLINGVHYYLDKWAQHMQTKQLCSVCVSDEDHHKLLNQFQTINPVQQFSLVQRTLKCVIINTYQCVDVCSCGMLMGFPHCSWRGGLAWKIIDTYLPLCAGGWLHLENTQ